MKKLTKEQEEQISVLVDKWYKNHLSTKQYSNEDIISSVYDFYKSIGKFKPKNIVILDSPVQCVQYIKNNNITIYNCIWTSINDSIRGSIFDSISYSIYNSIKDYTLNSFYCHIYYFIYKSISDYVYFSIYHFIWHSIFYFTYDFICLNFCINILQIKELEKYKPLLNLSEKVYWAFLTDDIIIIFRKLNYLHLDENNRLHADGVKVFEFNDRYGKYYNHGIEIPKHYGAVKTEDWKAEWLLTEHNIALKRLLIREIGYDKIAKQLNSTIIHKDQNMALLEIPNIDIEPMRLLKVECPSTNSIYILRVPPDINNCEDSRQWTLFNENDDYDFIKES